MRDKRQRLSALERMLGTLGYTETLRRGFAVVRRLPDAALVRNRAEAAGATALEIEFADGRLEVGQTAASGPEPKPSTAKKRRAKTDTPGSQGSLF